MTIEVEDEKEKMYMIFHHMTIHLFYFHVNRGKKFYGKTVVQFNAL